MLPGSQCSGWPRRHGSDVREDIGFGPAGEVKLGAGGKEIKTCLGQSGAMLAGEPFVQLFPEAVKIAYVRRRIVLLRFRQLRRAPVGRLLLLRSEEHKSELQSLMRISYAVL